MANTDEARIGQQLRGPGRATAAHAVDDDFLLAVVRDRADALLELVDRDVQRAGDVPARKLGGRRADGKYKGDSSPEVPGTGAL